MAVITLTVALKDAVSSVGDESLAIRLLQDYNSHLVVPEHAYGLFYYDGYEAEIDINDEDSRVDLISHRVRRVCIETVDGEQVVKLELEIFDDTKAGRAVSAIRKGEVPGKHLQLVSNMQISPANEGKVRARIVSFNFVSC